MRGWVTLAAVLGAMSFGTGCRGRNLAAGLAKIGQRVLMIDLDPQGNATSGLGFPKGTVEIGIYQALVDRVSLRELTQLTALPTLWQSYMWSGLFACFVVSCGVLAWRGRNGQAIAHQLAEHGALQRQHRGGQRDGQEDHALQHAPGAGHLVEHML